MVWLITQNDPNYIELRIGRTKQRIITDENLFFCELELNIR